MGRPGDWRRQRSGGKGSPGLVFVNGYSEKWLRRGFPWVYPTEIERGAPTAGAVVKVSNAAGEVLGTGIADKGFVAVRVMRHDDGSLDRSWIYEVLDRAAAHRRFLDEGSDCCRLVNAENDGLPGIRVDWWSHCAVIILDSPTLSRCVDDVVAWLEERRSARAVYLCYRPDPRDERDFSKAEPKPGVVGGHALRGEVTVLERGLSFKVRPWEGPDVGLYGDMRDVRRFLEPHWSGTSVLNTFAYTGAFSVAAAAHGAMEVTTVDLSSATLDRFEANLIANDLPLEPHDIIADDTFKAMDRLRRKGHQFDRIVLDPPSFSRAHEGIWSAKRDYPRLIASAARITAPGGWIIAASNQGDVSPKAFRGWVADGLRKAGRWGQEIWWGGAAPDFPAAVTFPEGRYLKVGVWRLV